MADMEEEEQGARLTSTFGQEAIAIFQVGQTRQKIQHAEYRALQAAGEREKKEDRVKTLEAQLDRAQSKAAHLHAKEKEFQTDLDKLRAKGKAEETALGKIQERGSVDGAHAALDIIGPFIKNEEGELNEGQTECLKTILKIRGFMAEGRVDEARAAECTLSAWINSSDENAQMPSPSELGKPGVEVERAMFVKPFSICSDQDAQATINYAKNHPQKVFPSAMDSMESVLEFAASMCGLAPDLRNQQPDGVNLQILNEIRQFGTILDRQREEGSVSNGREYQNLMWNAIEPSLRKYQDEKQKYNKLQLELPSGSSAQIARFNTDAHFRFASPAAVEQTPLTRALVNCELRQPFTFMGSGIYETKPRPFVYPLPDGVDNDSLRKWGKPTFHVHGDLMALCGENEVHVRQVPAYVNLETCKDEEGLKVRNPLSGDYVESDWCLLEKLPKGGFSECCADSLRGYVWSATYSGSVYAFSLDNMMSTIESSDAYGDDGDDDNSDDDLSESDACYDTAPHAVAQLVFGEQERKALDRYFSGKSFRIRQMGDCIVGSGNTPRLSVWNIQQAVEKYGSNHIASPSKISDSKSKGDEAEGPPRKVQKTIYDGLLPAYAQVEDDNSGFECGDIEWIGGSGLLVGTAQHEDKYALSLRHYDLEKETVVGLYCGMSGSISIEEQLCVERFNSIFIADSIASYVYDVRTYQPCMTLQTHHTDGQILGVPGETAMTAFAFCHRDAEEIQCWDLRMPSSHAYSMWTGNSDVVSLFWHEPSASLLAQTKSSHAVTWGDYNGYRYGDEVVDWEQESGLDEPVWPKRAVHGPDFFGDKKLCYHYEHQSIIQYSFANGKPMYEA